MRLKFLAALLLIINGAGLGRGQEGGLKEMLKKIVEEKVTDPYSKELFMSKFSDMQTCLLDMASMTPQVAMQVVQQMVPALNDCGSKLASEADDQKAAVYISCTGEAVAKVKAGTGMNDDDAKTFDDGMECLKKALGF
ncbi:uncharacterized protein LOC144107636 [Amblyomma americanum]